MLQLPLYLIIGLINIMAKNNNYNIAVQNDPNFQLRVKRADASETAIEKNEIQDKNNDRARRDIKNTENEYNFNQLNMPYTDQSAHGNQKLVNINPYNGNNYPYNNINMRPYIDSNTDARDPKGYSNTPRAYNTQRNNGYNYLNNNYTPSYGNVYNIQRKNDYNNQANINITPSYGSVYNTQRNNGYNYLNNIYTPSYGNVYNTQRNNGYNNQVNNNITQSYGSVYNTQRDNGYNYLNNNYTPRYDSVHNTQGNSGYNNDVNNNYTSDYGIYNSRNSDSDSYNNVNNNYIQNNGSANNYGNNYTQNNESRNNYLNNQTTTTPMNIVEGHIFGLGCPMGYRRVRWSCVKIKSHNGK